MKPILLLIPLALGACVQAPQEPLSPADAADFAQCSYEAVAATASQPGLMIPAINQVHIRNMCLQARALAREAAQTTQQGATP